jgi:parallel beta-helix repeat protein
LKKQLIILCFLSLLIFSSVNFLYRIVPAAKATYVEGLIWRDTAWTLVDSPFELSNNVTVAPGVTLTIEPGVEVRFGPDFSLVVMGRIVANGTSDKMIRFTSNKLTPAKGDWYAILFYGIQQSSMTNCVVEYGTSGMTIESGALILQDSLVRFNSENGTTVDDGSVIITNCAVANNGMNGISITGGSQVLIQNNAITSNGNGLLLAGNTAGTINIENNYIALNTQAGIELASTAYTNTAIINNNVSSNNKGFLISSDTRTVITHNYVSNNTVGIYYQRGNDHEAHFNDIYDNELAMDVLGNATVDATYNYWGHRTGPRHDSLNPYGKGNPVGGDGVNLDFIFFLSLPSDHENAPPVPVLWTDKILVAPNQQVTFIATDSYDDGRVDQYYVDFGDQTNNGWNTVTLFNHSYALAGTYVAGLWLIDDFNTQSEAIGTATVTVQNLVPLNVQTTLSSDTLKANEETEVSVYVSNELGPAENANVMLFSVGGGSFSTISGLTNSSGHFTSTYKAENVTELTNIRIIARASMNGRADGSSHSNLQVLPILKLQVTTDPAKVVSEEKATISVNVTDTIDQPVPDATVTIYCDTGTLSTNTGTTGSDGIATFNFTAPLTTIPVDVTLTVTANKTDYSREVYATAEAQITIGILPKIIDIQLTADPNETISEGQISIIAHAEYKGESLIGANMTVTAENGDFVTYTELTNYYGNVTFTFIAPQVSESANITVTVTATMDSFAESSNTCTVTVNPKTFMYQISAPPPKSGEPAMVSMIVTCKEDGFAAEGANVTLLLDNGYYLTNTTDSSGSCTFIVEGSQTRVPSLNMTFTISKSGFRETRSTITVTVVQPEPGFPWLTVLLIAIPVVIAVVLIVLIKLKVIVISTKAEEE